MTDYTTVLLTQLTDLQGRVSKQDATITALKAQVDRLSHGPNVSTMRLSVPLRDGRPPRVPNAPRNNRDTNRTTHEAPRNRKQRVSTPHPTLALSDVLHSGENVSFQIKTGSPSDDPQTTAEAVAVFDGTNLEVTQCNLVNSLVGMKSSKAGEVLYKFMESLKDLGHIKSTFGIAPWRLCFVERDGVRSTLEDLRPVA